MAPAASVEETVQIDLASARAAQARWAGQPVRARLRLLRELRHRIASAAVELAATVPLSIPGLLHRTLADTLCSEVFPLVEACRYLEREAPRLLAPRRQSARLRPIWLGGVSVETRREPFGVILIIGPGNYPLFLPGAQALQALAAGNAVLWKPAPGCAGPAHALHSMLVAAGLDPHLFTVLEESPQAAQAAIEAGVDKVLLTGSATTGRAVFSALADRLTPAVMELSGCDAVFVLEGADLARTAEAIAFGLRFNASATCMAPRRLILARSLYESLKPHLECALRAIPPVPVPAATRARLGDLLSEATLFGASIALNGIDAPPDSLGATLVDNAAPSMRITSSDIFAPVLAVLHAATQDEALALHRHCAYALTAAVFGPPRAAEQLAAHIHAGAVLINDIIVSTSDPRASFGGIGLSGFGSTRGPEGLLEMTFVKNILIQRSRSLRPYEPTTPAHVHFFAAFLRMIHGRGARTRFAALRALINSALKLNS